MAELPEKPNAKQQKNPTFQFYQALKKLPPRTRNQVRAIASSNDKTAITLLNKLRKQTSIGELCLIDEILRKKSGEVLPELFPALPQTSENYIRLAPLSSERQIEALHKLATQYNAEIRNAIDSVSSINTLILTKQYEAASIAITKLISDHGYSHIALRKAILVKSLDSDTNSLEPIESFLERAGSGAGSVITSSLLHCFKPEQDFLNMKRSIMSMPSRGDSNKFTRDMARLAYHPHAKDTDDLRDLLQSALQSSLIDAILTVKINSNLLEGKHRALNTLIEYWESKNPTIETLASSYQPADHFDGESLFYKHSGAWLECQEIINYRVLQDHFFDSPDAEYFKIDKVLLSRINEWVLDVKIGDLNSEQQLTSHNSPSLRRLETKGLLTRSSMFNYLIHKSEGCATISETDLLELMSKTRDLAKTINTYEIKTLAGNCSSSISKIVLHLLIANKNRNEADNYNLRRLMQQQIKSHHDGDLLNFVSYMYNRSSAVGEYIYEVCTEDFIAKLSHIINSSTEITETRAALHKWMGETLGEQILIDRARTLLIDHQINRVRNEIDDHRIYVDSARFTEWLNDEITRELSMLLISMEHNNTLSVTEEPQLTRIIERCYYTFCANPVFGIASYLGRRIRHGTFKGHLYSSIVSLANSEKYQALFLNPLTSSKWEQWKVKYEKLIDEIIKERLHVESAGKRNGLLKPNISAPGKVEIALICAKQIVKGRSE
ncbi:MAG: hypothetical protein V7751_21310 [Pseudoalteromonas distincta]